MRRKLIEAIWKFSKEEYEKPEDMLEFSKMSEEQLVENLINITNYYFDKLN